MFNSRRVPSVFLFALLISGSLISTSVQACQAVKRVEVFFFDYSALLAPQSRAAGKAAATRTLLSLRHTTADTFLREIGLTPANHDLDRIAEALNNLRDLSQLWLDDVPLTPDLLRRHMRLKGDLKRELQSSGCYLGGSEVLEDDFRDIPKPRNLLDDLLQGRQPITVDQLAALLQKDPRARFALLIGLLTIAAIVSLWLYVRHERRLRETRGYPRTIFTGHLRFRLDGQICRVNCVDIGRGGTKIHRHDPFTTAKKIMLVTEQGDLPCLVGWQTSHFLGISFRDPLPRSLLRQILRQSRR